MYVTLLTPVKKIMEGEALSVTAPGKEGEFTVLPMHEPFIILLAPGKLTINYKNKKSAFLISGGFAEVHRDGVNILVMCVKDEKSEGMIDVKDLVTYTADTKLDGVFQLKGFSTR